MSAAILTTFLGAFIRAPLEMEAEKERGEAGGGAGAENYYPEPTTCI